MTDSRFRPDGRSNRERMLAGDPYIADDPDLARESDRAAVLTARFNATAGDAHAERAQILRELPGAVGEGTVNRPPFRCDYGYRTHIGARTFANWGLIALDVGRITIGENTVVGAGAVVVHDLPPDAVAVGSPARIIRRL